MFKRAWLRHADPTEEQMQWGLIFQSWDIAVKTGDRHDFSVCTTWLRVGDVHYLLDLYRAKLEYPDLRRAVLDLQDLWRPRSILIEDTVAGSPLIQELRGMGDFLSVIGVKPTSEKQARAAGQSFKFETGRVFLPSDKPWLATLIEELLAFPRSRHDDQVDSIVQYLEWPGLFEDLPGDGGAELIGPDY